MTADKNESEPFYVQRDCCLSCGVPHQIAPDLFDWDKENSCYFKRQPRTKDEIDRTVLVLASQDVGCIRYGGNDPELLGRFAELGEQAQCDVEPPPGVFRVFRNHVTFDSNSGAETLTIADIAESLRRFLTTRNERALESLARFLGPSELQERKLHLTETEERNGTASFSCDSFPNLHYTFEITKAGEGEQWLVRHSLINAVASLSVSNMLHEWLIGDGGFVSIRWYDSQAWSTKQNWRETPW